MSHQPPKESKRSRSTRQRKRKRSSSRRSTRVTPCPSSSTERRGRGNVPGLGLPRRSRARDAHRLLTSHQSGTPFGLLPKMPIAALQSLAGQPARSRFCALRRAFANRSSFQQGLGRDVQHYGHSDLGTALEYRLANSGNEFDNRNLNIHVIARPHRSSESNLQLARQGPGAGQAGGQQRKKKPTKIASPNRAGRRRCCGSSTSSSTACPRPRRGLRPTTEVLASRVCFHWRKGWDSNPRMLAHRRFSRPLQSTTLPPFRRRPAGPAPAPAGGLPAPLLATVPVPGPAPPGQDLPVRPPAPPAAGAGQAAPLRRKMPPMACGLPLWPG